jgi:hypothetical protein
LLLHCAVYTAAVWGFSLLGGLWGLRPLCVLLVFLTHAALDQRAFVGWWCKHVTRSAPSESLAAVTDQAFHAAVLAAVCALNPVL